MDHGDDLQELLAVDAIDEAIAPVDDFADRILEARFGHHGTWLVQEQILASTRGKHVFVLRASNATSKSGLLADHEYIPFDPPHIERTFIPILEGLREIGF